MIFQLITIKTLSIMKKICMLLALTAFVFTSCSNNEDTAINQAENSSLLSRIKVVHIKNGQIVPASRVGNDSTDTALSFKTLKDFTDFKALLKYKSTEEKQMIVKSLGFNNTCIRRRKYRRFYCRQGKISLY